MAADMTTADTTTADTTTADTTTAYTTTADTTTADMTTAYTTTADTTTADTTTEDTTTADTTTADMTTADMTTAYTTTSSTTILSVATRTTAQPSTLPGPILNFKGFQVLLKIDCTSPSDTNQKLENSLYSFFQRFFKELDRIILDSSCNELTRVSQNFTFDMNLRITDKQGAELMKNEFKYFSNKLKETQTELESEFINIALTSWKLELEINFTSTIIGIENSIDRLETSNFCDLGTCWNSYFSKNCSNDVAKCEHDCDRMYCKNDAKCVPSLTEQYKPKCV